MSAFFSSAAFALSCSQSLSFAIEAISKHAAWILSVRREMIFISNSLVSEKYSFFLPLFAVAVASTYSRSLLRRALSVL